jgi:hypothetical protein
MTNPIIITTYYKQPKLFHIYLLLFKFFFFVNFKMDAQYNTSVVLELQGVSVYEIKGKY